MNYLVHSAYLLQFNFRVLVRWQYQNYQVNVFEFAAVQSHYVFLVLLEGQTQSQGTEQGCETAFLTFIITSQSFFSVNSPNICNFSSHSVYASTQ